MLLHSTCYFIQPSIVIFHFLHLALQPFSIFFGQTYLFKSNLLVSSNFEKQIQFIYFIITNYYSYICYANFLKYSYIYDIYKLVHLHF